METELTPEQKFNAESPDTMVPKALLEGRSRESIVEDLIRLDWAPEAAQSFVEHATRDIERLKQSPQSRAALVRESWSQMIAGLFIGFAGLLGTLLSLFGALAGLPVWILFSGAILAGLAVANRGYSRWRLYRRDTLHRSASKSNDRAG